MCLMGIHIYVFKGRHKGSHGAYPPFTFILFAESIRAAEIVLGDTHQEMYMHLPQDHIYIHSEFNHWGAPLFWKGDIYPFNNWDFPNDIFQLSTLKVNTFCTYDFGLNLEIFLSPFLNRSYLHPDY